MVNKKSLATFVRTLGNQVIAGFKHFLNNVKVGGDLIISPNSLGTPATNVLTVDGSGVVKTATAFTGISVDSVSKVKHEVKAGVPITKGQAVYVTGADGTNMIVGLASNASEATSTKTMGLSESTLATNGKGNVVTEGLLDGLDTTAATIGDPVWLGTGGNLIYGLANKPYAPAHLVFIGIVTRVNANNGEIFVKVQNGFELNEIHDVDLKTNVPVNGEILGFNGTLWVNKTIAGWLGYTPANASGTTNYVSKFTGTTTLGNSQIFDNGTNVGIGTATPSAKLTTITNAAGWAGWIENQDTTGNGSGLVITGGSNAGGISLLVRKQDGTSTMTVRGDGNVGIGTTSPGYKLEVSGTVANLNNLIYSGGSLFLRNPSNTFDWAFYHDSSNNLRIDFNGGSRLTVNSSGNVGIGTTSPANKLDVRGVARVLSDDAINAKILYYTPAPYGMVFRAYGSGANSIQVQREANDAELFPLSLQPNGGNVGIGTTAPTYKLQVVSSDTSNTFPSSASINVTNSESSAFSRTAGINFSVGNGGTPEIMSGVYGVYTSYNTSVGGALSFVTNTGSSSLSEKMRITSTGDVGIGTTSPSQKLDVNGYITSQRYYPYSSGSTYIAGDTAGVTIEGSGYFYVFPSAGSYFQGIARFRGGISNDTSTFLQINGGSSNVTYFNGTVGIGTTAPATLLHISGTGNTFTRYTNTTNAGHFMDVGSNSSGQHFIFGYGAYPMLFGTNGSEVMRITSGGNVGIGTTAPGYVLDVIARASGEGGVRFWNNRAATSTIDSIALHLNVSNSVGMTGGKIVVAENTTDSWPTNMQFYINSATSSYSPTEAMRITSAGNVGIGTTSPGEKLHVVGNIVVPNNNSLFLRDTANSNGFQIRNTSANVALIFQANNNALRYRAGFSSNAANAHIFAVGADTEIVRFTNDGNVGIGTSSPFSRLTVSGALSASTSQMSIVNTEGGHAIIRSGISGVSNNGISFVTANADGSSQNVRMVVSATGDVGIGATSPAYKLDVTGVGNFSNGFGAPSSETAYRLKFYDNGGTHNDVGIGLDGIAGGGEVMWFNALGGFYFGLGTNGTKVTISNTGNVGIGTSNPTAAISVVRGAGAVALIELAGNNNTIGTTSMVYGQDGGNNGYVWNRANAPIYFGTNGSTRMFLSAAGDFGIGTTSPGYRLQTEGDMVSSGGGNTRTIGFNFFSSLKYNFHVDGTSDSDKLLIRKGTTNVAAFDTNGNFGIGTTNPLNKLVVSNGGANGVEINPDYLGQSYIFAYDRNAGQYRTINIEANEIQFRTGSSALIRGIITSAGNFGIGTTSPGASLHVAGAINSTPTGDGFLAGIQSGYAVIHLNGSAATGSLIDFSVSGTDTKGRILYDNINNYFGFNTNGAERLKITSTGDVGIGTSSPSAKLHVIGNATVSATLSTANAKISGTLADSFNQVGTAGQVLSSTGTGIEWVTGGGGGGGSTIIVKDEGTTIGSSFTTLNFIGDNVNATASGSTAVIEVTGRASSGSVYYEDVATPFIIPGGGFADVEINTQTVVATVPSSLTGSNKLMATITFGVSNVSNFEVFNGFKFRLYNVSPMSDVQGTTHSWNAYMSKDEGCTTTVFTFHIPIDPSVVAGGDTIVVQADALTNYTPEIYYCALTLMEGTN